MLAANFKRTKIVATIGPASRDAEILRSLIEAGANGLRMNFSHGSHEDHLQTIVRARQISRELDKPVALIGDLQGPKLRVGWLPEDGLPLVRGERLRFQVGAESGGDLVSVQHDISGLVRPGERVLLRDGQMAVEVTAVRGGIVEGTITSPGLLFANQGINLPDADFAGDILTAKDKEDIKFLVQNDVDYIALSFVQRGSDILELKQRLKRLRSDAASAWSSASSVAPCRSWARPMSATSTISRPRPRSSSCRSYFCSSAWVPG